MSSYKGILNKGEVFNWRVKKAFIKEMEFEIKFEK
jgi:hypothetical protein